MAKLTTDILQWAPIGYSQSWPGKQDLLSQHASVKPDMLSQHAKHRQAISALSQPRKADKL